MTMKYSNVLGLTISQAMFLAYDDYDGPTKDPDDLYTISATGLQDSVRQIVLSKRLPSDLIKEVSTLYYSRMGQAYHAAMEKIWLENPKELLVNLGYPKRLANKIIVNPTKEQLTDDCIPVYVEQRTDSKIGKWTVSGKFDLVFNGKLIDYKMTRIYTFTNQTKTDDYALQGSIYRLLNPDIITEDYMEVEFNFGYSWENSRTKSKDYPQFPMKSQKIPLLDINTTRNFIEQKLSTVEMYLDKPEEELPFCSDEELWRTAPVYKYYSNPNNKTSTKNFDNYSDAVAHQIQKNKGVVIPFPGQVRRCTLCPAFSICSQKDIYISSGELKL